MDWIYYVVIVVLVVFIVFSKINGRSSGGAKTDKPLPYKKRDDFLSQAEKMFYATMSTFINGRATICPKVAVKEIVFVGKGVGKEYIKYFNWIAQKHVDFVICDTADMKVLCAVELDDTSHTKPDRKKRDEFLDKVFEVSKIPLFHLPLKNGYTMQEFEAIMNVVNKSNTSAEINPSDHRPEAAVISDTEIPICPKCGIKMVKRKVSKGKNTGSEFYGCPNYPKCRESQNTVY